MREVSFTSSEENQRIVVGLSFLRHASGQKLMRGPPQKKASLKKNRAPVKKEEAGGNLQLCYRDQNLCTFLQGKMELAAQQEMMDMLVNSYFSQGTIDGWNCINLLNVCSKFKFKGNGIFTYCVRN